MSGHNIRIVQRHIAAYNSRDLDALRDLSPPELELDWSASRGLEARVYRGLEETLGFFRDFLDTFETVHLRPTSFIGAGDAVVVPNIAYVTGRDGIETIARSTLIFEVRHARVARICLYQKTDEALEAAGL